MARPALFLEAVLVLILAGMPTSAQPTSLQDMFILDSAPRSLEANLVTVVPDPTYMSDRVATYIADCPKPASPENDACRAESIYPAQLWHTQGSMWGGTATARRDGSTTTWACNLAELTCVKTVNAAGATERVETTTIDECYSIAHRIPMVVTAGVEKLPKEYFVSMEVSELLAYRHSELTKASCPVTSTPASAQATASSSAVGSQGSTTGGAQPATGPSITGSQASSTASSGQASAAESTGSRTSAPATRSTASTTSAAGASSSSGSVSGGAASGPLKVSWLPALAIMVMGTAL